MKVPYTIISFIQSINSGENSRVLEISVAALTTLIASAYVYRSGKKMNFLKRWMIKKYSKKLVKRMQLAGEGGDVLRFFHGISIIGLLVIGVILLWAGALVFLGLALIGMGLILAGFYVG